MFVEKQYIQAEGGRAIETRVINGQTDDNGFSFQPKETRLIKRNAPAGNAKIPFDLF
jgi:hypothetical protein